MTELSPEMEAHRDMALNAVFNDSNIPLIKKFPFNITDNLNYLFYDDAWFLENIQKFLKQFPLNNESLLEPPLCFEFVYDILPYLRDKDETQLREVLYKIFTSEPISIPNFFLLQKDECISLDLIRSLKSPDLITYYIMQGIQLSEVLKLLKIVSWAKLDFLCPVISNRLYPIAYSEINNQKLNLFISNMINNNSSSDEEIKVTPQLK